MKTESWAGDNVREDYQTGLHLASGLSCYSTSVDFLMRSFMNSWVSGKLTGGKSRENCFHWLPIPLVKASFPWVSSPSHFWVTLWSHTSVATGTFQVESWRHNIKKKKKEEVRLCCVVHVSSHTKLVTSAVAGMCSRGGVEWSGQELERWVGSRESEVAQKMCLIQSTVINYPDLTQSFIIHIDCVLSS